MYVGLVLVVLQPLKKYLFEILLRYKWKYKQIEYRLYIVKKH